MDAQSLYSIPLKTIAGLATDLSAYKGKVLLVVNTASKCGYTPQLKGLETLFESYREKGLVVLGFPSNDFGAQEPAPNEEIQEFCELNYGVSFPLFAKGPVKGSEKQALFTHLLANASDTVEIKWNFEKFLIDRNGKVVGRFASAVKPEDMGLKQAIEKNL